MPPDKPGSINARALLRAWCLLLLLCASATLLVPHPTHADNTGLVGYWSFDDGVGTKATDFSGTGNTGTLDSTSANLPTWVNGKRGKALNFDGDSNYVDITGNPTSLRITGSMTVSAWIKMDDIHDGGVDDAFVAKSDAGGAGTQQAWVLKGTEDCGVETLGF